MGRSNPAMLVAVLLSTIAGAVCYNAYDRWSTEPVTIRRPVDSPSLLLEIQAWNELVSVKYTLQKVIGLEEEKIPLGSEKLLLVVQAEVLAGVDLSALEAEDVRITGEGCAFISLPAARVLHVVLDEDETRVWDREITWWTPWVPYNPDLERQARVAAREAVQQGAIRMGILDDARRNAQRSIRQLSRALGLPCVAFSPVS